MVVGAILLPIFRDREGIIPEEEDKQVLADTGQEVVNQLACEDLYVVIYIGIEQYDVIFVVIIRKNNCLIFQMYTAL